MFMMLIIFFLFHLLSSTDAKADTGDQIVTSVKFTQDVFMEPALLSGNASAKKAGVDYSVIRI